MEIKAKAKHIKISPRKVRLVADIIRGLKVGDALNQLSAINKKCTKPLDKLVNSAIANAVNNFELEKDNLFIKSIQVNEGATLHRWTPKARGRATPLKKRTSHVDVVLGELVESAPKKAKKQKIEAPIKLDSKPMEEEGVKEKGVRKGTKKEEVVKDIEEEKNKMIVDPRGEGRGKHTKVEGSGKGFVNKIFRRKSG